EADRGGAGELVRGAAGIDRVGQGQRQSARDVQLHLTAEHLRERGGCTAGGDVRQLPQCIQLHIGETVGSGHDSRSPSAGHAASTGDDEVKLTLDSAVASASQSTISAICPSASTAPPDTGWPSETIGGSGRVTSSRWPTSSSTARPSRRS